MLLVMLENLSLPESLSQTVLTLGMNAIVAILIIMIGRWLARRAANLARDLMTHRGIDPTVGGFVTNILYMVMLVVVLVAALSQLGIPTASFIAIIGAAGLAIGLALQGSLSNFASGVLLVTFRPARVNDYIEAAGVAGTVKAITVFSTTLVTPDQRTITVPNSILFGGPIINYSTSPARRLDLVFSVSYQADLARVKSLLREILESDPRVLADKGPVTIGVHALADNAVEVAVQPWVANADYLSLQFDLLERVKKAFDDAGIEIPYPQQDVRVISAPYTVGRDQPA